MARLERLARQILLARSDANIDFDLHRLLLALGFVERRRGSHHVFVKQGIAELVNLQRDGPHAKPYQVRQVRAIVLRYRLWIPTDE